MNKSATVFIGLLGILVSSQMGFSTWARAKDSSLAEARKACLAKVNKQPEDGKAFSVQEIDATLRKCGLKPIHSTKEMEAENKVACIKKFFGNKTVKPTPEEIAAGVKKCGIEEPQPKK